MGLYMWGGDYYIESEGWLLYEMWGGGYYMESEGVSFGKLGLPSYFP